MPGVLVNMTGHITLNEAMNHLAVSEKTIRRWIQSGKLKAEKRDGRWLIEIPENDDRTPGQDDRADDRTHLIEQLQSEVEHLRCQLRDQLTEKDNQLARRDEQIDHLQQLLAVSQKSIQQLTEQNQLLLDDKHHRRSIWQRIRAVFVAETG